MADLDLQAGRTADAAAHLGAAAQIALQTGLWFTMLNVMEGCGYPCAATGRFADAITAWAAYDGRLQQGGFATVNDMRRRERALRQACLAPGPDRTRAAEQRGAAMSMTAAAEYALMLTAPESQQPLAPAGSGRLSARERELVTLVARAARTPTSPGSCSSASAPCVPTWTGSGTTPAAAAAPT
jgi:hypothetical protein